MERALSPLKGKLREGAVGISLIKGFMIVPGGGIKLMSETITGMLGIPVGVLMGANLAGESRIMSFRSCLFNKLSLF